MQELKKDSFGGIDIALFSAGGSISKEYAPIAAQAGCVVVDNSSAFRMDDKVPLVIPEINAADVKWHKGIIANPNCTTAIALMALYPLHAAFDCKRIFASSYQAVSGTGAKAIAELERQVDQIVKKQPVTREVYPHQIAFNVLPHVDSFLPTGYTKEEMKMENEGRKIMHHPTFRASVTCVRVPVYRAHSVAVSAEFEKPVTVEAALAVLKKAPGLDVIDNPAKCEYPLPLYQSDKYNCAVGRLRKDCALDNGLCFWVCRRSTPQRRRAERRADRRGADEVISFFQRAAKLFHKRLQAQFASPGQMPRAGFLFALALRPHPFIDFRMVRSMDD